MKTVAALGFSVLAALTWIAVVASSANRGFDVTDEGFYLLSYRWWSENLRNFSGVQYLYGPVFELLGYDIARLRIFRLCTVVASYLAFGWAFMRWLRLRRPDADPSIRWEWAGTAAIVACGGMAFSWLPLSPGYNDVSLLTSVLATAIVLRAAVHPETWLPLLLGPVVVAGLLAKWTSSGLTFFVIAGVCVFLLRRSAIRFMLLALVSVLVTLLAVHLFVIPLTAAIPEMLEVNRLIAAGTNSPTGLLSMYAQTGWSMFLLILRDHGVLLLAALVAVFARGRRAQIAAMALGCAGLALSVWALIAHHGLHGGNIHLLSYPVGLLAMLLAALIAGKFRDRVVISLLLLLPLVQAAGTGNPLYYMAINAFGVWMAVIIYACTSVKLQARRWLLGSTAVLAVLTSVAITVTGVHNYPYRMPSAADTQAYNGLKARLQPYIEPEGRAIMAFDEMAGIVLLLDGRTVGEAWYSALDRQRTAAGIKAECRDGWHGRAPLLLFARPVADGEIDALKSCGFDFLTDYQLLAPKEETLGLLVYVPVRQS